ncbi:MAG: type I secretion C-terminal target domain-containing protein, partial [Gammaproteobacteria bacterium]|nr:type I secretion C-terminal target domain-containing protein [Gammaproteobacteria bacterium]
AVYIGGTGADTITGGEGDDTITGGEGDDTLTGGTGSDIFDYNAIVDSPITGGDTITDFAVTEDKLDLKDILDTSTNGVITDEVSLAKYVTAEADSGIATNVKLYIKHDGDGTAATSTNADMVINLTVADATAQTALITALNDGALSEYILA